jgi:DNA-binding MltR family transcriptional regulator
VMAAVVEARLGDMLVGRLVDHKKTSDKLFTGMGPLSSFSAKIDLGFLLGLYSEEVTKMLHGIRNIRNVYAHEMVPLDFASKEIAVKMQPLQFVNTFPPGKPKAGRELFNAACEFILGALYAIGQDKRRFKSPELGKAPTGAIS